MIEIGNIRLTSPVLLAPMAGITDLPFRELVQGFGVGLVTSEMVASQEMVQAKPGVRARAALGLGQSRTAVQLAARDPYWAGEAARMAQDLGAPIIDINMGCPARKVVGGLSGSALMREPEQARAIIAAITRAVSGGGSVPVTLKMRLGWDEASLNAPELAHMAEDMGVAMITVHGRTRQQFYKGRADWRAIGAVVRRVRIPVIANGDISSPEDARAALAQSGAAGVMVGRAAGGRPWLPAAIAHALGAGPAPKVPAGEGLMALVRQHVEASVAFHGPELGLKVVRKHLGWYMDHANAGAGTDPEARRAVLTAPDAARTCAALEVALGPEGRTRSRAA